MIGPLRGARYRGSSWVQVTGVLLLATLAVVCLSTGTGGLAAAVETEDIDGASSYHGNPDGPTSEANAAVSPQEAYEKAIYLLRTTLKNNHRRTSTRSPGSTKQTKKQRATAGVASSSDGQKEPRRAQGLSLYWQLLRSWLPFAGIYRDLVRLRDLIATFNPFPLYENGPAAAGLRIPASLHSNKLGWEGASLLTPSEAFASGRDPVEEEQARLYSGARPEQLWPEWDGGDDAYFGPFLSTTHEEASFADSAPLLHTTRRFDSSAYDWAKLSLPGASTRRRREAEQRQAADRDRERAIALLTWAAGWGDAEAVSDHTELIRQANRDWSAEAERGFPFDSTTSEAYIHSFHASRGKQLPANVSRPNADALWTLAILSFWGTHGTTPQPARAKACFERLTLLNGNASAHNYLGWIEGGAWSEEGWRLLGVQQTGLEMDKEDRQAKALMHYTAAAQAGDSLAQMTLGYRYNAGISVSQSCGAALFWYEKAAKDALDRFQSGPPGGLNLPYTHLRLSDLSGGVFGPGASAASTGDEKARPAIQAMLHSLPADGSSDGRRLEDLLEFFTYHAQRGEKAYSLSLARIYYGGSVLGASESAARVQRDYKKAREYLMRVTREVWPVDPIAVARGGPTGPTAKQGQRGEDLKLKVDDLHAAQAGVAAGMLGRMWLRGEGVPTNYARAWVWFQRGAEQGDTESFNGLGVMHQLGLGVPTNMLKAVEYFEMAATAGIASSVDGCMNLGKLHFQYGDYTQAFKHFELAMKLGSSFEAYYYLAMINLRVARYRIDLDNPMAYRVDAPGTASYERCRSAVSGFKYASERADWKDPTFTRAERAWSKGLRARALLGWSIAGERGYEAAQNNVAWVLDRDKKRLRIAAIDLPQSNATDRLALIHWIRSAAQDNVDALVKMGDYYFYGLGTGTQKPAKHTPPSSASRSSTSPSASYDKAAACYSAAASSNRQTSALAYWNMGYMYEHGLGVPKKDYNLAKRYYDMALELNTEAYLPVRLSIAKLFVMACWDALKNKDATALNLLNGFAFGPAGKGRMFGSMSGGLFDNQDLPYTEADELRIQRERVEMAAMREDADAAAGGVDAADLGDYNLPETYEMAGRANVAGRPTGENGGRRRGTEDLDSTIEGLMIVFGLAALAMLVYVRQGVQLRMERQRRDEAAAAGQGRREGTPDNEQRNRPGQTGRGATTGPPQVDPNQPFGWPLQDGNAYAGL